MGKIDELLKMMRDMKAREPRTASAAEVLHLAGSLIFLLYSCFDKIARGGLRPFYDWVTEHVDSATLWRTKDRHLALSPSLLGGWSSFYVHSPYSNRGCTTSVGWSGRQWWSTQTLSGLRLRTLPLPLTKVWAGASLLMGSTKAVLWKPQNTYVMH